MRILVVGATGGTGLEIVRQGLERGHEVTAFVRDPAKLEAAGLDPEHDRLHIAVGDALDPASIADALPGHDAVLVALGSRELSRTTVRAEGTRVVLDAMKRLGIDRVVVVTAMGVGDSWDQLGWAAKAFFATMLRQVRRDHELQEDMVRASDLAWTIVRPSGLTDGARTERYASGTDPALRAGRISRADVAHFVLEQLDSDAFVRRAPAVT